MGAAELLELQRLDDRVTALRGEIADLETRRRGTPELAAARRTVDERRAGRAGVDARVEALEGEAATLRGRVRVLDKQLYGGSVRNPAELLTLQHELEEARTRLGEAEDRELTAMESAEEAAAELADAEARLAAVESARAAAAEPEERRLEELRATLAATEAQRGEVASRRPAAELALYGKLVTRRHPAIVRLAGDACGGCRIPLGVREVHAVKARGGIVQCANCDRVIAP